MADFYLNPGSGNDGNNGTTWALAWNTLSHAVTGMAAGDRLFWFSGASTDSYAAAQTFTFVGTNANPNLIYSVNTTTNQPPLGTDLAAGASVTQSSTNAMSFNGSLYVYGLAVKFTNGAISNNLNIANASNNLQTWDTCTLDFTSGGSKFISGADSKLNLITPTIKFGNSAQACNFGPATIKGGLCSGSVAAAIPTTMITSISGLQLWEGFDFSAMGSGKTIVGLNTGTVPTVVMLKDCQTNPAVTVFSATAPIAGSIGYIVRTDSTGSVNQFNTTSIAGTESRETVITRVGGGTDFNGALFSKKLVTSANSSISFPFEPQPIPEVNTLTGSVRTVTLYGTINAGSTPNNDDIWIEVEYPKNSGNPQGGYVNSTKTNQLTSNAAYSSDGSTWNGGGSGGGWSPFSMSVTLTAQLAGPLTIRIFVAKTNTTYYIDPQPVFS